MRIVFDEVDDMSGRNRREEFDQGRRRRIVRGFYCFRNGSENRVFLIRQWRRVPR